MPEIAVDPTTGTVVVSWRDARDDAANARVATYITTSIDGGQTFSAQTYANPQNTAINAITSATDGSRAACLTTSRRAITRRIRAFGYGNQMGLAVFEASFIPVWAGNFNQASIVNNAVQGPLLCRSFTSRW